MTLTGKEARQLSREQIKALPGVQASLKEAKAAVQGYGQVLLKKHGSALRLRKYVVVALGFERLVWEEVKVPPLSQNWERGIKGVRANRCLIHQSDYRHAGGAAWR